MYLLYFVELGGLGVQLLTHPSEHFADMSCKDTLFPTHFTRFCCCSIIFFFFWGGGGGI